MQQVTTPPESAYSHIGAIVFVEMGKVYGLPQMVVKARILQDKERNGVLYLLVQADGMNEKWVTEAEILGYDWTQAAYIQIEKAIA